jgi:hypothetical protein
LELGSKIDKMGGIKSISIRKRCHWRCNIGNYYTEEIGIMNNRETRICILDLQDHHTSSVHIYCIGDCKIGKEVY